VTPIGLQCVSDISILAAPLHKIHPLLHTNLALNITMREHITERALELGENYLLFISGSAKERYQFILEKNPKLLEKFPLRFIASMIGITPVQLSRIRKKISD
jgi:5'(3')-deoxyribonucleotidase